MSSHKQNVIVVNSSHYQSTGSGNKFIYPFRPSFSFSSNDKIGVQSLSIFNSFYNISSAYGNNSFQFSFPCFNPNGANTAVFSATIGNAVSFEGQITNPSTLEITGSTIQSTSSFTGFVAGAKVAITGYVSSNLLRITSGTPAITTNPRMYINGSGTYIVSGSNASGWTLSDSALGTIGSAVSPSSTIFATGSGNTLYVTGSVTGAMPASGSAVAGTIYVQASGISSQTITGTVISTSTTSSYNLTNTTATYVSSRTFTAGVGTNVFTGFSDGTIYNGMQFFYGSTVSITANSLLGSTYTLQLDKIIGMFPSVTIQNVGIPQNSFSILTVSGEPLGSGIYMPGITMKLAGSGIGSNVLVQSQISSAAGLTGVAGVYKISYSPNTPVQTMTANNSVTNNTLLYVNSIASGSIQAGMIFELNGLFVTIVSPASVVAAGSVGSYNISTPSGVIPSIFPTTISASSSFSTSIDVSVVIPDGFYDATSLNYFLQNVCIANDLYLTDSTGSGINTYFLEVLQNSTYYGFQINIYPLPQKMPSTLTYPAGAAWTLLNNSNVYTPQIVLPPALQKYFGFSSGIVSKSGNKITIDPTSGYMSIPASTTSLQTSSPNSYLNNMQSVVSTYTFVSDVCPIINTVNSLVMDCNLIVSKYNSERSNTFFSIPLSSSFGNLITVGPFPPCLCSMFGGIYDRIELSFYDTQGNPVNLRDADATITLVLSVENDIQQRYM